MGSRTTRTTRPQKAAPPRPRPAAVPAPAGLPDDLVTAWAALAPVAVEAGTLTPATVAGFVDGVLVPRDLGQWMLARIELDGLVVIGPAGVQAHPLLAEYARLVPVVRAGLAQYALGPVDLGAAYAAIDGG